MPDHFTTLRNKGLKFFTQIDDYHLNFIVNSVLFYFCVISAKVHVKQLMIGRIFQVLLSSFALVLSGKHFFKKIDWKQVLVMAF